MRAIPARRFLSWAGRAGSWIRWQRLFWQRAPRLRREKLDPDLFRRCKKAAYGSRIRALNSMDHVGVRLAEGKLKGYHYYRFADLYDTIALEDVQAFLDALICQKYAAISVVQPKQSQNM